MADKKKGWDLASTRSLAAAAEWLRGRSDAVLVLVVRGERDVAGGDDVLPPDIAFAVDARVDSRSAREMVESVLGEMEAQLERERREKRAEFREKRCAENIRAAGGER